MAGFNLSSFGTGGLTLQNNPGTLIPQGPSLPGYQQGTANTVRLSGSGGQVLGAATGPSTGAISSPNPAPVDPFASANNAANQQNNANLSSLNTSYDQNAADLQSQLGSLGTQKDNALSSLDTQFQGVQSQVGQSKKSAQEQTDSNTQDALSTAQQTQADNRNKLRALGILNSSAAGDLLTKPLNAYDHQRAQLNQALMDRNSQLDDFLNQKTAEHANAVQQIQSQYGDLVGKIQSDLRFNDRQRSDAIQAANAALSQRMAEIQQAQFSYQSQVQAAKQQTAAQLQQLSAYQAPTANLSDISSQTVTPGANNPNATQQGVNIFQGNDPTKKLLSGLSPLQ